MKPFVPYFKEHFYQKLLQPNGANPVRNRADSLLAVFELLDAMKKPTYQILETGCMRADHGELCFGDDGCATYIFDKFVNCSGGVFISVDINPENCEYAQNRISKHTRIVCSDSVKLLYSIPASQKFDLVYLDSFDIVKENPHPSQLHHLKELCAVLKNCDKNTIVVVDDHDAFFTGGQIGKGNYVKDFMQNIGAKTIHEGYQIVFQL